MCKIIIPVNIIIVVCFNMFLLLEFILTPFRDHMAFKTK